MKRREKYTADLLIPLANPQSSESLTAIAGQLISRRENREVTLVNFIRKSGETQAARDVIATGRRGLGEDVTVNETVRFDSNPARGIIKEAREEKVETIVMGWHSPDEKRKNKGRVLDSVLNKAPCDVIIAKDYWYETPPRQILVPLSGIKANDELAVKTAEKMLDNQKGGRITILYFNKSPIKLPQINYLMTQVVTSPQVRLDGIASDSDKPVKTTVLQSREFDLTVLGINEPRLFRRGKPTYTERVAQESPCSILMVRTAGAVRSRINFFT